MRRIQGTSMPCWGAKLPSVGALLYRARDLAQRWGRRGCYWRYRFSSSAPCPRCGILVLLLAGTACLICGLLAIANSSRAASLDGLAVEVVNASQPALCAESD